MRQQLLKTIVACAAGLALGAQAQSSSSTPGGSSTDPSSTSPSSTPTSPSSPGSYGTPPSSQSGWSGRHLSATGRMMGHEVLRGSQLTGAQVTGSSGTEVGTISDFIINPNSGRLEFAVISLGANAGGSTGIGSSTSSSASASGKQVAVPWMLLRPSSTGSSTSAAASTSSSQQPAFTFAGDTSKLESAPNFDANTDLTQPSWRQSVFSYFGLSGSSSATGGAFTPGGSSTGTSGSSDLNSSSSGTSGTGSSSGTSGSSSSSGSTTPQSSSGKP